MFIVAFLFSEQAMTAAAPLNVGLLSNKEYEKRLSHYWCSEALVSRYNNHRSIAVDISESWQSCNWEMDDVTFNCLNNFINNTWEAISVSKQLVADIRRRERVIQKLQHDIDLLCEGLLKARRDRDSLRAQLDAVQGEKDVIADSLERSKADCARLTIEIQALKKKEALVPELQKACLNLMRGRSSAVA